MIKETVLEIEFQPIFDKWGWRIVKQNEDILKRGTFRDKGIGVYSYSYPGYYYSECVLNIRGNIKERDNLINICTDDEKREIEVKVRNINEKYGIKKRWRANKYDYYHFLGSVFEIQESVEMGFVENNERYKDGNYFRTKEEAEEYANYMKECSYKYHKNKINKVENFYESGE